MQRAAVRLETKDWGPGQTQSSFLSTRIFSTVWNGFAGSAAQECAQPVPEPEPVLGSAQQAGADIDNLLSKQHFTVPAHRLVVGNEERVVPPMLIARSRIPGMKGKGWGVMAKEVILKGTVVAIYGGEHIDAGYELLYWSKH